MGTISKSVLLPGETSGPQRVPRHICIYVISGELTLYFSDQKRLCHIGDCINLSPNTPYVFRNEGSLNLIYAQVFAPLSKDVNPIKYPVCVTIRKASDVSAIGVVGDTYALLMEGADTDFSYALIDALITPGGGPPPHVHTREVEAFYVAEGAIDFMVSGRS
jgi:quercetin dioxygenase-like cupin family protein